MGTWSTETPISDPADYRASAIHTATGATILIRIQETVASDTSDDAVAEPATEDLVNALVASGDFSNVNAFRQYPTIDTYAP